MNSITTAYSYDDNDRLTSEGAASYSYDLNGNTVQKTEGSIVISYDYDARNRLVEVTKPSGTLQYGYDTDGIRTSKTEGGVTTNYVVDHNRQYAQVLAELENGALAKTYTYGDDLVSQQAVGGSESFYLYDGLGTTRGLTDASGGLSDEYFYEAFGELLASTGSTENDYLFTGEQFDADLEQYYLRARYYDPSVGRFTQMDTWQGRLQEPVTLHKYLYANADPVNGVDPSGNVTVPQVMTAVNIAGTLASFAIGGYEASQGNYAGAGWAFVSAGFWGSGGFKLVGRFGTWWKVNRTTRKIYKGSIRKIEERISTLRAAGKKPDKDFLQKIVDMRNDAKRKARELMDPDDVRVLEKRNLREYGNVLGPSADDVLKQYGTVDAALEAATRSNRLIDAFFWVF